MRRRQTLAGLHYSKLKLRNKVLTSKGKNAGKTTYEELFDCCCRIWKLTTERERAGAGERQNRLYYAEPPADLY